MKRKDRNKLALRLFKTLLRIRIAEETLAGLYPLEEMRTPTHFSIGQEAVAAGVCAALRKDDSVFASHRCHAAYLAKGGDLKAMASELYGRATGVCGGRAGSAHLSSPGNRMYASPILSAMIPVSAGAALSYKMDRKESVAACFFGDAAIEEGVFAESVNFAVIKRLPLLLVCENNLFSTHTHIRHRQPDIPIYRRVGGLGMKAVNIDGNDLMAVYEAAEESAAECRRGRGPVFMECKTYRYREHVGPRYDYDNPYRTKGDVERWMKMCPVLRFKRALIKEGLISDDLCARIESGIRKEISEAVSYARRSPWPEKDTLTEHVY